MAKKKTAQTPQPRVSFPIILMPKDNSRQTLPLYKMAKDAADSIYYPNRLLLYNLFDEVILDTHVDSCIDKVVDPITNVSWAITDTEGESIEETEVFLNSLCFNNVLKWIIQSRLFSHSLIEFIKIGPGLEPNEFQVELVPRRHVSPVHRMVFPDPNIIDQGYDYTEPPFKGRVLEVGDADDLGKLYKVAPYVILKKGDISDWASYCEVFGSPLRVGHYDPHVPGNESAVIQALKKMGNLGYAAMPNGSTFEYIQDSKSGTGNTVYESFADFCNKEISKCLNGQTMTAENGASLSQAKVHKEVLDDKNLTDREFVAKVLTEKLIPVMRNFGFNIPPRAKFTVRDEDETLTKKERLEMDLRLHKEVAPLKKEYFQSEYNVEFDEEPAEPAPDSKDKAPDWKDEKPEGKDKKKTTIQRLSDFFLRAPTR